MAPGNQSDAFRGIVGAPAQLRHCVRRDQNGLEDDLGWNCGHSIQSFGNFLRMLGDFFQGLRPVEMLAAGDKPNFQ